MLTHLSAPRRKNSGPKIALLTAYDYPTGRMLDDAGIDLILVGDCSAWWCMACRTPRE